MSTSRGTASHFTLNPGHAGLVFWKQSHMWAMPYSAGIVGDSLPVPKRAHLITSLEPVGGVTHHGGPCYCLLFFRGRPTGGLQEQWYRGWCSLWWKGSGDLQR